jgi:hypothetical protein
VAAGEDFVLDVRRYRPMNARESMRFICLNKTSKAQNGEEVRTALIGKAVHASHDLSRHRLLATTVRFATNQSKRRMLPSKCSCLSIKEAPGPYEEAAA